MSESLERLRERLPDYAKDIKLNLGALLASTTLTPAQTWGVALAAAGAAREGCESCVRAHEHVVVEGGVSEDQVLEAVRLGSVVHAAAVGLELGG